MLKNILTSDMLVNRLSADFSEVKLLAMGQTIYWDEPMKAILRRHLDNHLSDHIMVAGVHDADYFSKISANTVPKGWSILPHNDGATRDLWVAAGEISRLFGSETIPYRDLLSKYGVQLDKIARDYPGGRGALVDIATEAWGWRGLVHSDEISQVSCCVLLKESLPHLKSLLKWGFAHTIESLAEADKAYAGTIANQMLDEIDKYAESNEEGTVADMYCSLLVEFYSKLLGYKPKNLEITRATELFKFNKSTAGLLRFTLLDMFLNKDTHQKCQNAYDLAVEGSDAYTLDRFPDGAIPFDLVVPFKGRGTICLRRGRIVIDMDDPITIECRQSINSVDQLAEILEGRFGENISVVGKAITLVLMMASEFIFVLNEEASTYVPRCVKMASIMKENGIGKYFYPILRMKYQTWDSISELDASFELPAHIASAANQSQMTAVEFGSSWKSIVKCQEKLLAEVSHINNIDELLTFLAERQPEIWESKLSEYNAAASTIRNLSNDTEPLKAESVRLRDLSHTLKQEAQQMDISKGEHFRTMLKPLLDRQWQMESEERKSGDEWNSLLQDIEKEKAIRSKIEKDTADKRNHARLMMDESLNIKHKVREMEKSRVSEDARKSIKDIVYEAELARLWIVRDAILVSKGLRYTDNRPSAWWFLMTDLDRKWFNKVSETVKYYFEEISA